MSAHRTTVGGMVVEINKAQGRCRIFQTPWERPVLELSVAEADELREALGEALPEEPHAPVEAQAAR
jgi:hypothetical protein